LFYYIPIEIISNYSKCFNICEAEVNHQSESQSVPQCPFLDIIKPTLKVANPEMVQDIFEQRGQKRDSGLAKDYH